MIVRSFWLGLWMAMGRVHLDPDSFIFFGPGCIPTPNSLSLRRWEPNSDPTNLTSSRFLIIFHVKDYFFTCHQELSYSKDKKLNLEDMIFNIKTF